MKKMKSIKLLLAMALLTAPVISKAVTFSIESEKRPGVTYTFDIDRKGLDVVLKDGKPWVLGEGSMGIAIVIEINGTRKVLKYFKNNGHFSAASLKDYELFGKLSILDRSLVSPSRLKSLRKANGAAEDVVFGAQQFAERSKFFDDVTMNEVLYDHKVAAAKMVDETFTLGTVDVEPIDMKVRISKVSKYFPNSVQYRTVTGLIKPFLVGESLKKLLEENGVIMRKEKGVVVETIVYDLDELAQAVCNEVFLMSKSGNKYDDLNEANWIVTFDSNGGLLAIPFDMKPAEFIDENFYKAVVENFKAVLNKVTPNGLSSGEKRDRLIRNKQRFGFGQFHASIKHDKTEAIDTLKKRIEHYIDFYSQFID